MPTFLQNPEDPNSDDLLETLLSESNTAESGGGAFAFVSPAGAKLLLDSKPFERFKSTRRFDLIVGTDAITGPRSLAALTEATGKLKGLSVRAFLNEKRTSLFHPKFCWFRNARGGTVITGSGNLTSGGLFSNWEAFSVERVSKSGVGAIEKIWNEWTALVRPRLRPLTDAEVIRRAEENARRPPPIPGATTLAGESPVPIIDPAHLVLIAELPKGDRWKQADVGREAFEGYFGARPGSHKLIYLYHAGSDGALPEAPEVRPAVSVKSHNYRFELGAAIGPYPKELRPIAVFIRVGPRTFRYRLLMPDDLQYSTVADFLDSRAPAQAGRIRRIYVNGAELKAAWPESPLWIEPRLAI